MRPAVLLAPLLAWFHTEKRSFPWRQDVHPYSVLVSEMMLQQTQASRVISYFLRWMESFPTIITLAQAEEGRVIKAWEGLGYYSRARSLHACAKIVCERYGGVVPSEKEDLLQLPGIGPYTAGAIRSFAYHQRAEAIDANVRRVLFRMVKGCFENGAEGFVEQILPEQKPWEAMEALIELGALMCTKVPNCEQCPCKEQCYAYSTDRVVELTRHSKSQRISLWRDVAVFLCQGSVLVKKSTQQALMAGLYEFPYLATKEGGRTPLQFLQVLQEMSDGTKSDMKVFLSLSQVKHSFTKYQAYLYPVVIQCENFFHTIDEAEWIEVESLSLLPFSSGHRKVLGEFLNKYGAGDDCDVT